MFKNKFSKIRNFMDEYFKPYLLWALIQLFPYGGGHMPPPPYVKRLELERW